VEKWKPLLTIKEKTGPDPINRTQKGFKKTIIQKTKPFIVRYSIKNSYTNE